MKHVTHYVWLDLIELTRAKPHSWCSTRSVTKHLAKQAAFARYCAEAEGGRLAVRENAEAAAEG